MLAIVLIAMAGRSNELLPDYEYDYEHRPLRGLSTSTKENVTSDFNTFSNVAAPHTG